MKYLSEKSYGRAIKRYFSTSEMVVQRLVGPERRLDAGYFNIVRFFGEQRVDPGRVTIQHRPDHFAFHDKRIAAFSREVEERLRSEGRLHVGPPATHLINAQWDHEPRSLTVQPCRYGDMAGSCFALDWQHPLFANDGLTLREYYLRQTPSRLVTDNPLAICLGVCGMVSVSGENGPALLTVRRSATLASWEGSWGPSVAGSVDYDACDDNLERLLMRSLAAEIEDELGLQEGEYTTIPLACAREIYRGERPQLFCLVNTPLSREEITYRLRHKIRRGGEYDEILFADVQRDRCSPDLLPTLNTECQMNCALLEEYWSGQNHV